MLPNQINAWLTDPVDYDAGLLLLRQTGYRNGGPTSFVLTVLAMGDDAYNRNRLETELRKWLRSGDPAAPSLPTNLDTDLPSAIQLSKKPTIAPVAAPEMSKISAKTDTQIMGGLMSRRGQLLDERADLKARIRAVMDDETRQTDRRDWAFRIKAVTRDLDELYSQLDFFDEYGYLPPSAADPAVIVDDQTLLLNVRTYVSRYRAKVKKAKTDAERQSAQILLDQYEVEKKRLETKLTKTDAV